MAEHEVAYLRPTSLIVTAKNYFFAKLTRDFMIVQLDATFTNRILNLLKDSLKDISIPISVRDVITLKKTDLKDIICFNEKNEVVDEAQILKMVGEIFIRAHITVAYLVRKRGGDDPIVWPKLQITSLKYQHQEPKKETMQNMFQVVVTDDEEGDS
jgi:hypothetical protein